MTSRKNMSRVAAVSVAVAMSIGVAPYALAQEDADSTSTSASATASATTTPKSETDGDTNDSDEPKSDKEVVEEPSGMRIVYPDASTAAPGEDFTIEPIELIKKGIEGKEDTVEITLGEEAPKWVNLDSNTGVLSGTIPADQADGEISIPVIMNNTADENTPAAKFNGVLNVVSKDSVYPEAASVKPGKEFTVMPSEDIKKMIEESDSFTITDEELAKWVKIDPKTGVITGTLPADFEGDMLSIPVLFKHGEEETQATATVKVDKGAAEEGTENNSDATLVKDKFYPNVNNVVPGSPFIIKADEAEFDASKMTAKLAEGNPEWVKIDNNNGSLMGTVPTDAKLGKHEFKVEITDDKGEVHAATATLMVVEATAVGNAPVTGATSSSRPTLASTGANVGILAGLAGALVLAGAGALVVARRKGAFNRN